MVLVAEKLAIFFHPLFSDGGVERTNIYLGKGLVEKGYDVEFLTTRATDHFREEVGEAGIRLVEMGGKRTFFFLGKIVKHLVSSSQNYNCVYFIGCQYYANVVAMFVAMILKNWKRNIRFINSERNHFQEFAVKGGLKNRLIFFLVRHLYRFADVIIANAEETAKDLSGVIGRKVHWVHNPTINERIEALRNVPVDESWFSSHPKPCVMGIGRLSLQKDFATLIKAFRLVRDRMDAKLVILGEGGLRRDLELLVRQLKLEEDVFLPGFVRNPYKFLASSDVFVLSSRYEGLPNVLIEAAYLGIPCVSTLCKSGPHEILLEGAGGELVQVGDSTEMARAIISVLSTPVESRKKSNIAFHGTSRFHYDNAGENFEKMINL